MTKKAVAAKPKRAPRKAKPVEPVDQTWLQLDEQGNITLFNEEICQTEAQRFMAGDRGFSASCAAAISGLRKRGMV